MAMAKRKGRRPADVPQVGRQEIWTAIRTFEGPFTFEQLLDVSRANRATAKDYLRCLAAGRVISASEDSSFNLIKDCGFHAPRLNRQGQPVTQGVSVENMWRSMRMMPQFSWRDIAVHSTTETVTVSGETAKSYCYMLLKCGYLRVMQKADVRGRLAVYKLIRNTGPQPPQVQRVKQIFDPNTREVFVPEDQA